jgi:hypothetical protein
MSRVAWTRLVQPCRRTAVPLAAYYAVTLVLPLANGAAQSGAFAEHALVVLVVPLAAVMLASAIFALFSTLKAARRVGRRTPSC